MYFGYCMKKEKFLTIFAVFDDKTQSILDTYQKQVFELGYTGEQTMGLPFHITLGSFPTEDEAMLTNKVRETSKKYQAFDIDLIKTNDFNNKVLFIEPKINEELLQLHKIFDNNYANGFPWHPHATIYYGEKNEVIKAKAMLDNIFKPIKAKIVGIQMGEFFPPRMIIKEALKI